MAGFFPKRPKTLRPESLAGETKVGNGMSEGAENAKELQQREGGQSDALQISDAGTTETIDSSKQTQDDTSSPYTDEHAGMNNEGEQMPPTLDVPDDVKADGPDENEGKSTTIN